MLEQEDKVIFSQIIKAVRLRDKYVVGGASLHPLEQEAKHPASFSVMALSELATGQDTTRIPETPETFWNNLEPASPESPDADALMQLMDSIQPETKEPEVKSNTLPFAFEFVDGVIEVYDQNDKPRINRIQVPSIDEFYQDMDLLA